MARESNLWAVVFNNTASAEEARTALRGLQSAHCLILDDVVVVTRLPDGTLKLDREPNPWLTVPGGLGVVGFLAGLVVAQPLAGAVVGALAGSAARGHRHTGRARRRVHPRGRGPDDSRRERSVRHGRMG